MVDHHEARLFQVALHAGDEAVLVVRAILPDAGLARRGDLAPDGVALAERDQLGDVAGLGVGGPVLEEGQRWRCPPRRLGQRARAAAQLVEAAQAEVVAEALAQGGARLQTEVLGDEG